MWRPSFHFATFLPFLALLACCTPGASEKKNTPAGNPSPTNEIGDVARVNSGGVHDDSAAKPGGASSGSDVPPANLIKRIIVGDATATACAEEGLLTYNGKTLEARLCLDGKLHADHFGLNVDTFKSAKLAVIRNPKKDPGFDLVFIAVYGTEFFDDPFFQSGTTEISGRGTSCVTVKGDADVDSEWSNIGKAKEEINCPAALKGMLAVGEKFPPEDFVVSGGAPVRFADFKR